MSLPNPFMASISNPAQHVPQQRKQNNYAEATRRIAMREKQQRKQSNSKNQRTPKTPASEKKFGRFNSQQQQPNDFFCAYCNEEFVDQMELQVHRRSHQKCPYDECKFNANELKVAEHIQKVHIGTKIKDLTSPEDIEKWRQERRKRYPTTSNVQLRQQIQEMKQNRGERLHDSKARFGDKPPKDKLALWGQEYDANKKLRKQEKKEKIKQAKEELKKAKKKARKLVKRMLVEPEKGDGVKEKLTFKGTSDMKNYHQEEAKNNSALSLLSAYGSASESDDDEEEIKTDLTDSNKLSESRESINDQPEESTTLPDDTCNEMQIDDNDKEEQIDEPSINEGDEHPEEVINPKEDIQPHLEPSSSKRKQPQFNRNAKKPKTAIDYSKLRSLKSTNPFLEKLLHREIVHERNYLLQCVNYVVKNNFFGIGQGNVVKSDENS